MSVQVTIFNANNLYTVILATFMAPENVNICIFGGFHLKNTYNNNYQPIKSCQTIYQTKEINLLCLDMYFFYMNFYG